jgi:hypothetical protein
MTSRTLKRYWITAVLVCVAGIWLTWHAGERDEMRTYSLCVNPHGGNEAECKKIRSFRAPNGYFAHSAGFLKYDFLLIDFLYPSMKPWKWSLADLLPFRRRDPPPGEIPIHITVRRLGRPFEDRMFDALLQSGRPGETFPERADEMYGLRMRKESGIQDPLRKQQFVPANGAKAAVVECDLPWRSVDGRMFTDVSCHIWSKLGSDFYIDYYIKRKDLPQWQDINRKTQQLIDSFKAG